MEKKKQMNDNFEKVFLNQKFSKINDECLKSIEHRLNEFETSLQKIKNDALKSQQVVSTFGTVNKFYIVVLFFSFRTQIQFFVNKLHIKIHWNK